ncbi:hypothetical protein AAC691_21405 [Nguyenibacter vanlangensis]|uniref:Uncharacterized protein n=1 Tax=Nguyenibacter vanlangensis TaxID=1216886 RepID=A0ABZ3D5F8_9PROT
MAQYFDRMSKIHPRRVHRNCVTIAVLVPRNTLPPRMGGILAALCRSPLVGADLDFARSREEGRKVDL